MVLCMKLTQCDTRLVAGSEAGKLLVICTQTSTIEQSIYAHYSPITCLAINSTDTFIATGKSFNNDVIGNATIPKYVCTAITRC